MSFQAKLVKRDSATVFLNNQQYTFDDTHPKFVDLMSAVKNDDSDLFQTLFNYREEALKKVQTKGLTIDNGAIFYNGEQLHSSLIDRILEMVDNEDNIDSMVLFLENLMQNPSRSSITELYDFLSNINLPITDDGCFLGYKSVVLSQKSFVDKYGNQVDVGDYVDKYTRTIRNNIGDKPTMERRQVDDDRRRECSYGYHVGALDYVTRSYVGDVVLIVKVNPKDVVSVPMDYNCQKLRTTTYEVVSEFKGALNRPVYYEDDELEFDEEFDEDLPYYVDIEEVETDDYIKFSYKKNGATSTRYLLVDIKSATHISGWLRGEDPSYNTGVSNYRMFNIDNISEVQYIDA